MKKLFAVLALLCLTLVGCNLTPESSSSSSKPSTSTSTDSSVGETTDVYFYNSKEWDEVAAYVFVNDQALFGSWPGNLAEDIGEGWWKASLEVDVSETPFNIIFNDNGNGEQAGTAYIEDEVSVYVNFKGNTFDTKAAAIEDLDVVETTKIYFYNSDNWTSLKAYGWALGAEDINLLGAWPGTPMTEEGDGWWYVIYPFSTATNPVNIIITGETEHPRSEVYVNNTTEVYLTVNSNMKFASKEAAEASLIVEEVTKVYFYNHEEWTNLHGYVYYFEEESSEHATEPLGGWAGRALTEEGDNWWSVDVPLLASETPFNIIFNGTLGETGVQVDIFIDDLDNVYTSVGGIKDSDQTSVLAELDLVPATRVYFYNSVEWNNVRAHVWYKADDVDTNLFGNWPGKAAKEIGDNWYSILVYLDGPFNIIFNGDGGQTGASYIENDTNVYVNVRGELFTSKEATEESVAVSVSTKVYFYNSNGWTDIKAHVWYGESDTTPFGGWPGKACTDEGDGWYSVEVPLEAAVNNFNIIFNGVGGQTDGVYVTNDTNVYTTVNNVLFASMAEALASLEG